MSLKPDDILLYLALKYNGDWDRMYQSIKNKESVDEEELAELLKTNNSQHITILDRNYPEAFRHMCKPPLVLFYYGDLSIIKSAKRCVAYVGSRDASPYGSKMAKGICSGLVSYGYNIISGLARGIDTAATLGALEAKGKAVAVLGNGIDYCYPSENKAIYERLKYEGLIISEYPGLAKPTHETFPFRNRLIAVLSAGVVVGEASRRSGTLITVNYALGENKDVGCVPYHANEESACNRLIKEGAFLIESAEDVLLMIGDARGEKTA